VRGQVICDWDDWAGFICSRDHSPSRTRRRFDHHDQDACRRGSTRIHPLACFGDRRPRRRILKLVEAPRSAMFCRLGKLSPAAYMRRCEVNSKPNARGCRRPDGHDSRHLTTGDRTNAPATIIASARHCTRRSLCRPDGAARQRAIWKRIKQLDERDSLNVEITDDKSQVSKLLAAVANSLC